MTPGTRSPELIATAAGDGSRPKQTLFIVPRREGDGFRASVRGHMLDLVDPTSYALAPTTDDLFIVSIAAALAWSAQRFLRERVLPDYVSVTATWRAHESPPHPADIELTVAVSKDAAGADAALTSALERSLDNRFLATPVVRVSLED